MSEAIIVALISGLCTAVPVIILNISNNNKTITLVNYRLDVIEKKQDKHNEVVYRTYELEKKSALHDEQIKVANHRIDDLEEKGA